MRRFGSVDGVRAALAAALGLSSFACGGFAATGAPDGGSSDAQGANEDASAAAPDRAIAAPDRAIAEAAGDDGRVADVTVADVRGDVALPDATALPLPFGCVDPAPLLVSGIDTGYDVCRGGTLRRRKIVDCPVLLPRASRGACPLDGGKSDCSDGGPNGALCCGSDSDCTAQPYGTCEAFQAAYPACQCTYGCKRDSDCSSGQICVCGDPVGQCEEATCNAGTCGDGLDCADYTGMPGCPGKAFACQTIVDRCFSDSDCDGGISSDAGLPSWAQDRPPQCTVQYSTGPGAVIGARACAPQTCIVGRPFLVLGEARLGTVAERTDWCERTVTPALELLSPAMRERLAVGWLEIARMEHASIAAFARFVLHLLAVGAPPELVVLAQRAMADETKHAKLTFALASAYAGRQLGPGRLAVDSCLDATDLCALVTAVFEEGCIGETTAAVEARHGFERAQDPVVRAVLDTIATDETRHAALAWRTIAWAIKAGGKPVFDLLEGAAMKLAAGLHADTRDDEDVDDEGLLTHGLAGGRVRASLRRAAVADVVLPCLRTLLARIGPLRVSHAREANNGGGNVGQSGLCCQWQAQA